MTSLSLASELRRFSSLRAATTTRVAIAYIFAFMVISSPLFILVNPNQILSASYADNPNWVDTSAYHSTLRISDDALPPGSATPIYAEHSALSQEKKFTTEAALTLTRASQTNNLVSGKAYYDISFRTSTAGVIKTVEIDFPPGTYVGAATLVEVVGISPGKVAATGSTGTGMKITYTVTNAVNVPALTNIRIQLANINNPQTPGASYTVAITTKDEISTIIDGPTTTTAYNMKQVATADIANNAITTSKIADSAVTTPKIADEAITISKLSPDAIPSAALFAVWQEGSSGNTEILFRRAVVFDPEEKNLSDNSGFSGGPDIAISGNNVYVVWHDNTPGNTEVLYRRSLDGGATFGPVINLSNNIGDSDFPSIAASGNNVYVAWEDNTSGTDEIMYRRSTDGGANFDPTTINLSNDAGFSFSPSVSASGNNVYVAWSDSAPGTSEILYRRSTDGGANFDPTTINLSNNAGGSAYSVIATLGDAVYVVWSDTTSGNAEILYRRSTDGGANFDPTTINLSNTAGNSEFPSIATSGNDVFISWREEAAGNFEIFYRRSTDGGANFDPTTINLSNTAGFSADQEVIASGNKVYVVWNDNESGLFQIWYRKSTDGGANFDPATILSNTQAGISLSPAAAYYDTQL